MKRRNDIVFAVLHTLIPLSIGIGIYILVRPDTYIAKLCITWNPWLTQICSLDLEKAGLVYVFLRNYACDMLWAYALAIGLLWYGRLIGEKQWQSILTAIGFGILMEGLQILPTIPGTFDVYDVAAEVFAIFVGVCVSMIFYNYQDKERGEKL